MVYIVFLRKISEHFFHYILFSLTTMYNNLIVSHVNKPRYVDISRYMIYRFSLTLYRYSDIVLKQYDTRH